VESLRVRLAHRGGAALPRRLMGPVVTHMTAGNVRRVKLEHNQPPHTGAACGMGRVERGRRRRMGGRAAAVRQVVGGIGFSWRRRLATRALGDWGKRAQVSFLSKKKKKKKKEEEEEEGQGSRVLTSLVST